MKKKDGSLPASSGRGATIGSPDRDSPSAFQQTQASLEALVRAEPDPAMLLDREGNILLANEPLARLVGRDLKDVVGQNSLSLLPPDMAAKRRAQLMEVLRSKEPSLMEEVLNDRVFISSVYPILDDSGRVIRVAIISRDVTSLKTAQEKLKESETLYRTIVESANDGIVIFDQGKVTYANPRLEQMGGYAPGEAIGAPVTQFISPAELGRVGAHLQQRIGNDAYRAKYETILIDKDGRDVYVEVNSSALPSHDGRSPTLVIIRDITDRKKAEKALREAEDKYRRLVDHSLAGVCITQNLELKFCNQRFAEFFGYGSPEELVGLPAGRLVAPESWDLVRHQLETRDAGEAEVSRFEFRGVRKDGLVFELEAFGSGFDYQGRPASLATVIDITERRAASRALAVTNRRLQALLQALPDIVFFKDVQGRVQTVNIAFEDMVGQPRERLLGRRESDILPAEIADRHRMTDEKVLTNLKPIRFQEKMISAEGLETSFETYKAPIYDEDGRPAGLIGVSRDITEQKRREKIQASILRISQAAVSSESLDKLLRSIHTIIAELMPAKNFYIALYDEETRLLSFPYFVDEFDPPPDPKPLGKGLTEYVLRTGTPLLATPGLFTKLEKDGEVESIGAPSIDWVGVPLKFGPAAIGVLVVQSYTEGVRYTEEDRDILRFVSDQVAMAVHRRRAAEDIQDRERFLAGVLDSIQDGISILDRDFTILRVNQAMEKWYAHAQPLVGKKCFEAYHLRRERCTICPTAQTLETGQASSEIVPLVGAEGAVTGWLDLFSFPFIDPKTGQMKGVIEYVRDISQRKQAEDRLQASLREKEVLLREVHHRVKNNLQVIQSLISLQSRRIDDKKALEMYKESQRRIRSMALIHERLYQSTDLSRVEFADYVRSLVAHLFHSILSDTGRIELKLNMEPVLLDINTAIPCGLIVNELVSNALKHAFPDERRGVLTIVLHREDGDFRLDVRDDGVGLPPGFDIRGSETLGMQIVETLVSQIGGRLEIGQGPGAEFRVRFRESAPLPGAGNHA